MVCEQLGRAVCEEQIRVDMMEQKAVVSELFSSVCVEIRDEVGFSLLFKSGEQNKHFFVSSLNQFKQCLSSTGEHSTRVTRTARPNGCRFESHQCWKTQC